MWIIIVLLVIVIILLLGNLNYKRRVINSLKISKKNEKKRLIAATIDVLLEIKNTLNTYLMPATRDQLLRDFLNDTIQSLSDEYKKYELNTSAGNENV